MILKYFCKEQFIKNSINNLSINNEKKSRDDI